MEAIEIIVYIGIAVIVGGLFLVFLRDIKVDEPAEVMKQMTGERGTKFQNVDNEELMATILEFWDKHQYKDIKVTEVVYVKDEGMLNKAVLFDFMKENFHCQSLQSKDLNCGTREDVIMGDIRTPTVIRLTYENDTLYISPETEQDIQIFHSYDMVTFGGFEGQGELMKTTRNFSNNTIFLRMVANINSGRNFYLYINDQQCNDLYISQSDVDRYEISECLKLLVKGKSNNISVMFPGEGDLLKYFGGGYIKIDYATLEKERTEQEIVQLPGIDGIINLFSAFSVPGTLTGISAMLHYYVDNSTNQDLELRIGNNMIYTDTDKGSEKSVTLGNADFDAVLDYGSMSRFTNPFRLITAKEQDLGPVSNSTNVTVDVVLVTDLSGSMMDEAIGGTDSGTCGNPNTLRIDVALCVDKLFVDEVLTGNGSEGNRVGLVGYNSGAPENLWDDLTNDTDLLKYEIDNYPMNRGYTCVSCGIGAATILLEGSAVNHKVIVVMSDGEANRCTGGDPRIGGVSDCGAAQEMILYAQQARELGIEVYSVAFGEAQQEAMLLVADDANHFGFAGSARDLEEIFIRIGQQIKNKAKTVGISQDKVQTIPLYKLNQTGESHLYPDSYIRLEYTPDSPIPDSRIIYRIEQKVSGCQETVYLPTGFDIESAYLYTYSGVFWTKEVRVNNQLVFDLFSQGNQSLNLMGDPFEIYVPSNTLSAGANMIDILFTGNYDISCGNPIYNHNSFAYSVSMPRGTTKAVGCRWQIEHEDGRMLNIKIPLSYTGSEICKYTSAEQYYINDDVYSTSTYQILQSLDIDADYRIRPIIEDISLYNT